MVVAALGYFVDIYDLILFGMVRTVPNFVRGSLVVLTSGFQALREPFGILGFAIAVGVFSLGVAFIGLAVLRETFGVDLDFHEDPRAGATSAE